MVKNILIFSAHGDDEIIGMGGSILKYLNEGKSIIQTVFTTGEKSHPHFKEEIITNIRRKEMEKVAKKIGIKKLIYFNLKEGSIKKGIEENEIKPQIKKLIEKANPEKIFTVSSSEIHPDHRAVNEVILEIVDSLNKKYQVYTFNIWTFPKLIPDPFIYTDISDNFWKKIDLMKEHKSQWISIYLQLIPVIFRAKYYGYKSGYKYAEKFE